MNDSATLEELEALTAAVDGLLTKDLDALPSTEVTSLLSGLETQRRRLEAVDQRVIAQVSQRGIAGEYGRTGPADLLIQLLRVTPREARARVGRSVDLGPRRAITGEPLEPICPLTAAAVAAGEISAAHTDVITDALDRVGQVTSPDASPVAEQLLVEAARHQHPKDLARTASMLLARLDPDGREPKDALLERRRGFSLVRLADGSALPRGLLTADVAAAVSAVLDALAAPAPAEGVPDQRSAGQRWHDALGEVMSRILRSDTLPSAGGVPVTILATTTLAELQAGAGVAVTGHGDTLSITQLLRMSSDARVIPVVCNEAGGVLAYGRGRRLASPGQRLALAARDGGCSFPGCDRPAAWTEVHHIPDWIADGRTDLDKMCLLCRYHHRHFAQFGWEPLMRDGIPLWRPPAWLDRQRRPIRNTAHHRPDIDFTSPAA
jgi:hypothetical protein